MTNEMNPKPPSELHAGSKWRGDDEVAALSALDERLNDAAGTVSTDARPGWLTFADIKSTVEKLADCPKPEAEMQIVVRGDAYRLLLARSEAYEAARKSQAETEAQLSRAIDDLGIAMQEQIPGHCRCCQHWSGNEPHAQIDYCYCLSAHRSEVDVPGDGSGFCWKFEARGVTLEDGKS